MVLVSTLPNNWCCDAIVFIRSVTSHNFLASANVFFGSVHKRDIAKLFDGEERMILQEHDIKEIGEYEIKIKLGELKAKITLVVEAE